MKIRRVLFLNKRKLLRQNKNKISTISNKLVYRWNIYLGTHPVLHIPTCQIYLIPITVSNNCKYNLASDLHKSEPLQSSVNIP